ncbi:unnamed protein product [Natator depressus]
MGLSRPRTPRRVLQEAKAALLPTARAYLDGVLLEGMPHPPSTPGPLDLLIGPLPRRPNRPPDPFTASRLHELQPVHFQTAPRKHLYMLVLHTLHALTLVSRPDTKWRDLLPPLEGEQPRWASLYSTLVPRPVGDISWRLLHGAVSTGTYLAQFTPIPDTCPFCGVRETLAHVYLECARLQPLFHLLTNLLLRFWLHFSPHLFIYALPIRGLTKWRDLLVNLLLALAKTAIYKTRERRLADGVSCDCGAVFRSSVCSRIRAEFLWAASTDSLDAFEERWALSEVLCSVSPSGSLCHYCCGTTTLEESFHMRVHVPPPRIVHPTACPSYWVLSEEGIVGDTRVWRQVTRRGGRPRESMKPPRSGPPGNSEGWKTTRVEEAHRSGTRQA